MNAKKSLQFIAQAIKKTKNRELNWRLLPKDMEIKPLLTESDFYSARIRAGANALSAEMSISREDSYVANYKGGTILLLTYRSMLSTNYSFSLRLQDESKYSTEIAYSSDSNEIATSLLRLYNIIDKDDSSLRSLIDDFLNS